MIINEDGLGEHDVQEHCEEGPAVDHDLDPVEDLIIEGPDLFH